MRISHVWAGLLFFLGPGQSIGQLVAPEVLSASGGNFIQNIELDWTLGEIAISDLSATDLRLTQGFHQPSFLKTGAVELPPEVGEVNISPNPFAQLLRIELLFPESIGTDARLFSVHGQLVWEKSMVGRSFLEEINLAYLTPGSYFLHFLIDGERYTKTIKLNKI